MTLTSILGILVARPNRSEGATASPSTSKSNLLPNHSQMGYGDIVSSTIGGRIRRELDPEHLTGLRGSVGIPIYTLL